MAQLTDRIVVRALAALCVLLAVACATLAAAWTREHREAACWRAAAEDNETPPEGDCHRPLKAAGVTLLR